MTRQIKLNFHANSAGVHAEAWGPPYSPAANVFGIEYYQSLARIAERGLFDAIFFADTLALHKGGRRKPLFDALVMVSALSAVTERLGLVATATTTFNEPYNIARQFATLDHVTKGRAAWNVVTSYHDDAAANFGLEHLPPKDRRYDRAEEFVDVVKQLWDGWDYEAILPGHASDASLHHPHPIDHKGKHFSVAGPLQVPLTPQGHPIIFQAGASEEGRNLAARTADGVFSAALTIPDAQVYYADIKRRASGFGRNPESVKILPGVYVYPGSTAREVEEIRNRIFLADNIEFARKQLAERLLTTPDRLPFDKPIDEEVLDDAVSKSLSTGHLQALVMLLRRERPTVRDFLQQQPPIGPHRVLIGTPEEIADSLEEWFVNHAADGFNVGNMTPEQLEIFVDFVVPILQKRGLFRTHYAGSTLRSHFQQSGANAGLRKTASA